MRKFGLFVLMLVALGGMVSPGMMGRDFGAGNIRLFILGMKKSLETDRDSLAYWIDRVSERAAAEEDGASAAVLHSMAGELYHRYLIENTWNIQGRTDLADYVPDDVREWTENLFEERIRLELGASLRDAELLQRTPLAGEWREILSVAKEKLPSLYPTLYDFLAKRATEILSTDSVYIEWIAFRRSQGDARATIMTEIAWLNHRFPVFSTNSRARREAALDSLLREYDGAEGSVEIIHEQISMRIQDGWAMVQGRDSLLIACWELCKRTIERFPRYDRLDLIRQALFNIESTRLESRSLSTAYPGKSLEVRLEYRHVKSLEIEVYDTSLSPSDLLNYSAKVSTRAKRRKAKVGAARMGLPELHPALTRDTTVILPAISKPGIYEYVIKEPGGMETSDWFAVSSPAAVARTSDFGTGEVVVTDLWSGVPLPGASVIYYMNNDDKNPGADNIVAVPGSFRTDSDGVAAIPDVNDIRGYKATLPGDQFALFSHLYNSGRYRDETESVRENLTLITDRAIYRLGQTVRFKGILIRQGDKYAPIAGRRLKVELRDTHFKEVANQEYTTNEYGSFHGEFVLPSSGLTGDFRIICGQNAVSIRVEQYKRPGFRVEIEPVRGEFVFGDEVKAVGRAVSFAGVGLAGAKAEYTIVRRPWFRSYLHSGTEVDAGSCPIDSEGRFVVSFWPSKADERYHSYEITVRATDEGGETQEGRAHFSVGEWSIVLLTDLRGMVDRDTAHLRIDAQTLNGEAVRAEVLYSIQKLKDTKTEGKYEEGELLAQGATVSGDGANGGGVRLDSLPSGRVRLRLKALDTKGREVETVTDFVLFSRNDARPPVFSALWTPANPTECMPGDTAVILFGTSHSDTYILCEAWDGPRLVVRKWERLSDECRNFSIPFLETYRSLTVSFLIVKEGKYNSAQLGITRKEPSRALRISPKTFRDLTRPGATETWTFRVEADSVPVEAEIVAGMYDASLDEIQPFSWDFDPVRPLRAHFRSDMPGTWRNMIHGRNNDKGRNFNIPQFGTERLDWNGGIDYGNGAVTRGMGRLMGMAPGVKSKRVAPDMSDEAIVAEQDVFMSMNEAGPARSKVQLRENFAETAFFYPQLRSDRETGEWTVNVRLPDGNTTWKLQALAHTRDVRYGQLSVPVIARKEFMIQPNVPRFIRRGDVAGISARVVNLSEEAVRGSARLDFFDPESGRDIVIPAENKAFGLQSGESRTVDWSFVVKERPGAIGLRFIAEGTGVSDGEQHIIPLLSEMIEVTDATPFYLYEDKRTVVELPSAPVEVESSVIEVSSNPVWYAVQALPALAEAKRDDAVSRFAAYYAHAFASHIVRTNPRLREVIAATAGNRGGGESSSALDRGSAATGVGLSETPWVNAAEREAQQIRSLSRLFDPNLSGYLREETFRALASEQNRDGGWGWFKGMHTDRTITMCILQGMITLSEAGAVEFNRQEKEMMYRALGRLDSHISEEYENLRKQTPVPDGLPSSEQIEYLYLRSKFRDVPEPSGSRQAIRYYTSKAEQYQSKGTIAERARIAVLMYNNGKRQRAVEIVDGLRQTAATSPERGMYWPNARGNYFHSAIDVHCMLLTAFRTVGADASEVGRMRQWLLSQKQTQSWEATPSTVNAVAAILDGNKWVDSVNRATVRWGDREWSVGGGDVGTGHARLTVVGAPPASLEVEKSGPAPAWGAVYRKYHAPASMIDKSQGALHLEKKLFVETTSAEGRRLRAVESGGRLKVGEKVVVRLVIRVDRDMDYVCLADMRPGCIEPASQLSGTGWADGLMYYRSTADDAERFYFDHLSAGTFVMEYAGNVVRNGTYSCGIATAQCSYAPEFVSRATTEYQMEVVKEDLRQNGF